MKKKCVLIILFVLINLSYSRDFQRHQINLSCTLSGHILLGVGYSYWFDAHQALQATIYPLMLPGEGWPYAFNAGYGYYFGDSPWRPKVGLDFAMIVSPPDPDQRKTLSLLNFSPGLQYRFDDNVLLSQIWLSYFVSKKTRSKFAPTGLEFQYGRALPE
jgi:hypothetical protein